MAPARASCLRPPSRLRAVDPRRRWPSLGAALLLAAAGPGCGSSPGGARVAERGPGGVPCDALAARSCAHFGDGSEACATTRRRAARFGAAQCADLLESWPQTVGELAQLHEALRQLALPEQGAGAVEAAALGPADARVTIVQFSDFGCAECARISPMARAVRDLAGEPVRFVFRHLPGSARGRLAAEASLAAAAQGRFLEFHDAVFASPEDLSPAALERHAARVGLDLAEFRRALEERRFAPAVDADLALARRVLLAGAPALFVNGRRVAIPEGLTELLHLVADGRGPYLAAGPGRGGR